MKKKLGIIINPIAGMGGRVGLKGTDGEQTLREAIELGAVPVSGFRAMEAFRELVPLREYVEFITCPSEMGADIVRKCGIDAKVLAVTSKGQTTAADTRKASREMVSIGIDLILFSGGDGTARDILESIDQKAPVLGIPAGVKMHSGVFALSPRKAGLLAAEYLNDKARLHEAEVMDIDEEAFRGGRLSARLCGYLRVPYQTSLVQDAKTAGPSSLDEMENQRAIAECVVDRMDNDYCYILGPGTTVRAVAERLGVEKTLLGVDVVRGRELIAKDQNERELLAMVARNKARIIVSPIGGQGFMFGRGNQQISPEVICKVGKHSIIVIATRTKLLSLGLGRPLLVDTGDPEVDLMLSGYSRVIVDYNKEIVMRVSQ